MMPNDAARRDRRRRRTAAGTAAAILLALAAAAWGPLAASPTPGATDSSGPAPTGSPAAPASAAAGPSGSPRASASGPAVSPSGSAPAGPSAGAPDLAGRLQASLDRLRAQLSIPGVSVAILWDDGRVWTGASGMSDLAAKTPMTPDTAVAFASVSKTLTAAVVLQLVEEGRLALDGPVAPLLPRYGLDRRITVRMLLDHTSGLPDFFMGAGVDAALRKAPNAAWTAARAWSFVPKARPVPGRTWSYSNTNYLLLGELVTAVTGQTLAHEVRSRLLDPLGLDDTYYQAVEAPRGPGTLAYQLVARSGGGWTARPVAAASGVMPFRSVVTAAGGAGSIAGTALDAARWMRAWAGGGVLEPGMQAQMLADVARTVRLHAAIPYGLGIQRASLNGHVAWGHTGRYLGIRNVVRYLPDAGVTVAVLTNQSLWDPNRIASALLKVVLPPPPSARPAQSAPAPPSGAPSAAPSAAP